MITIIIWLLYYNYLFRFQNILQLNLGIQLRVAFVKWKLLQKLLRKKDNFVQKINKNKLSNHFKKWFNVLISKKYKNKCVYR